MTAGQKAIGADCTNPCMETAARALNDATFYPSKIRWTDPSLNARLKHGGRLGLESFSYGELSRFSGLTWGAIQEAREFVRRRIFFHREPAEL